MNKIRIRCLPMHPDTQLRPTSPAWSNTRTDWPVEQRHAANNPTGE